MKEGCIMSKIVLELQREALKSNSDVVSLLRKAYLVARKLKLKEFESWINNELNGYKDDNVPIYRMLNGTLKGYNQFYGWTSVQIPREFEKEIKSFKTRDSITSLVNVCNATRNNEVMIWLDSKYNKMISSFVGFEMNFAIFITTNQIYNIIERIKTTILDWTINLEENGILGENLEFSNFERECAQKILLYIIIQIIFMVM